MTIPIGMWGTPPDNRVDRRHIAVAAQLLRVLPEALNKRATVDAA